MKSFVVDASVAVKWFLPEVHADAARKLLSGKREFLAPDLIGAEVGNALWKKLRRKEITRQTAQDILKDFKRFPLQTYELKALLEPAWDFAEHFQISIYDCLYLALAVSQNCKFVTADRQFYNAFKGQPLASTLTWVEDI